ncbi:unnamed protein product [Gongylonema pulchrum]|uniref:ATPase_AAA_core domain-containing protein n=1 Tax=Gongylonema pulchrum TaxID=637853 RepID=A0A183EMY6_9BILA|nr:unnamed protein product [Gongylonema pulchrum]
MASPCVIFFDELDSLAPSRGRFADSGGVVDRHVLNMDLIAEIDSLDDVRIFLLGATNRPDLLDPSLLIPGRFDIIIEVGRCKEAREREHVLRAAGRNVNFADDVNLEEIAHSCALLSTGAELQAVISRASLDAVRKRITEIEENVASPGETLLVSQNNLRNAVKEVILGWHRL